MKAIGRISIMCRTGDTPESSLLWVTGEGISVGSRF